MIIKHELLTLQNKMRVFEACKFLSSFNVIQSVIHEGGKPRAISTISQEGTAR